MIDEQSSNIFEVYVTKIQQLEAQVVELLQELKLCKKLCMNKTVANLQLDLKLRIRTEMTSLTLE